MYLKTLSRRTGDLRNRAAAYKPGGKNDRNKSWWKAICIINLSRSLVLFAHRKLLIKFTHRGIPIPVASSSRGGSTKLCRANIQGYPGLLALIDREEGTCRRATVISIIYLSGKNGAWRRNRQRPNDSSGRRHVVQKRLFFSRREIPPDSGTHKDRIKASFPE